MARRYSVIGSQTYAASDTIVSTDNDGTTVRHIVYELILGSATAPADNAFNITLGRITAPGTFTAVEPVALDSASPASLVTGGSNHTAEPTYTAGAELLNISMNQQATFRWVVPPEEGFISPVTAASGFGVLFVAASGGTPDFQATIMFQE
jgi:hypothetical protein